MNLRQDLNSNKFIFTAELNPLKTASAESLIEKAKPLKNLVSAINITDNSGASMKMASLAASYLVQRESGIEAIWQMTCRDRNRLGLQSDLLGGWALGLRNILILSGDPPDKGDAPTTKGSFDLKRDELLKAVANLKQGKDYDENPLAQSAVVPDFCTGAAAHPGVPDLRTQSETMIKRRDAGAEFFQTQIVFDVEQLKRFADSVPLTLAKRTLIGITPLKSVGQANFINKNIWGVKIPEHDINAMTEAIAGLDPKSPAALERQHEAGLKMAEKLVAEIRKLPFKGVHVMAIGQEDKLAKIITTLNQQVLK